MIQLELTQNEPAFTVQRSPEFAAVANKIQSHLADLPLTNSQHNTLVDLIIEQIAAAEITALKQGIDFGIKIVHSFPKDIPPATGPVQ